MKLSILILCDDSKAGEKTAHRLRGEGHLAVVCSSGVYDHKRDYRGETILLLDSAVSRRDALSGAQFFDDPPHPPYEKTEVRRGPGRPPKSEV